TSGYSDIRGQGTKIYDPDGNPEENFTLHTIARYDYSFKKISVSANAFLHNEKYLKISESLNSFNEYRLYDTETDNGDLGGSVIATYLTGKTNKLSLGAEYRTGSEYGTDIYFTSTDELEYQGNLSVISFFAQDETALLKGKLNLVTGLRYDAGWFTNGSLLLNNPSIVNYIDENVLGDLPESSWNRITPRIGVRVPLKKTISVYANYGHGFMPPKIDDMVRSGKIRKGNKEANPNLQPEILEHTEIGAEYTHRKISISLSGYYSTGRNFQYLIGTGDTILSGSGELKEILKKENIALLEVKGVELGMKALVAKPIIITASMGMNYSEIKEFDTPEGYTTDLTGKFLNETPVIRAGAGIQYQHRRFSLFLTWEYTGEQWADEENLTTIDPIMLFNGKISVPVRDRWKLSLDINNLLDKPFIDKKGYLSPGRFIYATIRYTFPG
ncbi:MAG: TonB-dependent receptor, partial [Bacteroidetes bacterium]|nr:TonB-dependent receptor [Bacteroidota bacterium]